MNQYIITEELLQEAMENTTWGRTNQQKFRDKLTPYQSERDKVLDDIPDVLVCQSLPNEHGFCGKNDCFCKELQRVESGDICKWMQENRLRQSKAGEQ